MRSPDEQLIDRLRSTHTGLKVTPVNQVVQQARGKKTAAEQRYIRQAVDITVLAHREAMAAIEPGMNEFEIQALIEYTFRRNGADRPSFATIVGSGPNSTTLHYNANDRFIEANDVIVMDIGASYKGYAADVTRTVPASGNAIDIALWDGNARSVSLPLWRYLGAFRRDTVPAYFSGGYYRTGNVDEVIQEVQQAVASGFNAVKLKIGKGSPAADAARVAAAREIIGPDGLLLLDANNAWADFASALRAVKPLLRFDPFLIEEPFPPEDYENHRRLAGAVPVAIASGELAAGRTAHRALIEQGGITVLQPDAAVCGGITEWKRIAAAAASASVPVMPHSFHDLHVHLVASVPNGLMVEYFHDASVLPFRKLIDRQLQVCDGELVLPQDPGLGFSFLPSELERYSC